MIVPASRELSPERHPGVNMSQSIGTEGRQPNAGLAKVLLSKAPSDAGLKSAKKSIQIETGETKLPFERGLDTKQTFGHK